MTKREDVNCITFENDELMIIILKKIPCMYIGDYRVIQKAIEMLNE